MKYYLSGPMSLYSSTDYNFGEFNRITAILKKDYHEVINPAEINKQALKMTWAENIIFDISYMFKHRPFDVILIPNWKESTGSIIEVFNAIKIIGSKLYEFIEIKDSYYLKEIDIKFSLTEIRNI